MGSLSSSISTTTRPAATTPWTVLSRTSPRTRLCNRQYDIWGSRFEQTGPMEGLHYRIFRIGSTIRSFSKFVDNHRSVDFLTTVSRIAFLNSLAATFKCKTHLLTKLLSMVPYLLAWARALRPSPWRMEKTVIMEDVKVGTVYKSWVLPLHNI